MSVMPDIESRAVGRLSPTLHRLILAVFIALAPGTTVAQDPSWTIERTIARSDLIVVGEVIDIAFRDSSGGEGFLQAPHTFVTVRIEQRLRGDFEDSTLVLRLTGGHSPSTGQVMIAPHAPMFRVGNRDVLFIRNNGSALCPLVGCALGRFRVVDDKVFGDKGLAVRMTPEDRLSFGPDALPAATISMEVPSAPASRLNELRQRLATDTGLTEPQRQRLGDTLEVLSRPRTFSVRRIGERPRPPDTAVASLERFAAFVRRISERRPRPLAPVTSVSPDSPIRIETPPAVRPETATRPAGDRAPTLERMLLKRNGGNPVLEAVR